jgi:hypothetical protein
MRRLIVKAKNILCLRGSLRYNCSNILRQYFKGGFLAYEKDYEGYR